MEKPIEDLIRYGKIIRPATARTRGIIKLYELVENPVNSGTYKYVESSVEVYVDFVHSFLDINDNKVHKVYFLLFPTQNLYESPNGFHPKEYIAMNISKKRRFIRDTGLAEHRPCLTLLTVERCGVTSESISKLLPFSTNKIHRFQQPIYVYFGFNDLGEYAACYAFEKFDLTLEPYKKVILKEDSLETFSCPHNPNILIPAMEYDRDEERSNWE